MTKALHGAYDIEGITKAENELKQLQAEADQIERDNVCLHKVKNANKAVLKELSSDAIITKTQKKGLKYAVIIYL